MTSIRLPATILIALSLVIAVQTGVFAAGDQPDYQRNTSVQNIWENHLAWLDYTGDLDAEIQEAEDLDYAIQLIGEALSASLNYQAHLNGFVPEANCAWDFWYMTERISAEWTQFYAAMYFQSTATVGGAVDLTPIYEHAIATQEHFGEFSNWTEAKCINKLDI